MPTNRGDRITEAVVALSQAPAGLELARLATAMGAPLSSAQRAVDSLVASGFASDQGDARPRPALDRLHPAARERVELALRILPEPRAMEIVLRANPAVEFAGSDDGGYLVVLSPFAEPADVVLLRSTVERITAGRAESATVALTDRDAIRDAMRGDPRVRERGLRLRVVTGSAARMFPDPDRHRSPDAVPLGRLHPTVGRVPRADVAALADRLGITRIRVFGSAVRSDFRPDSDIDVIIETKVGTPARLGTLLAVERLLERAFGRDVDVVTPGTLDDAVRERVDREGVAIHG